MEFSYQIDESKGLITEKYRGVVELKAALDCIRKLTNDPKYSPSFNIIVDLSEADMQFDMKEIKDEFVEDYRELFAGPRGKTAHVYSSPRSTAFGYAFKSFDTPREIEIFSSFDAALEWIES